MDSCKKHAEEQWAAVGTDALGHAGIGGSPGRRPGAGLVDDMRQSDHEMHPFLHADGFDPSKVQRGLLQIIDSLVVERLTADFERSGRLSHVLRINEIGDESQDHSWLWALGKRKQQVLPEEEFVIAVRLRLGADLIEDAITCAYCHEQMLDSSGHHALVCAGSHATRGHSASDRSGR